MVFIARIRVLSQRKAKNANDYYVAGRTLPAFMLVATICASVVGGNALNAVACIAVSLATYRKYAAKEVTFSLKL